MTRTLANLDRLIGFDTVSAASNLDLIAFVTDLLRGRGFRVARVVDPTGTKAGLFACAGPETGAGIVLSAHSDVVPAEGQAWTRPPFRLTQEGDRLFGRGTTDMKGFLAAMLALAERTDAARLQQPLMFSISYDEEIGCVGMGHMIAAMPPGFGTARVAIVGEPTEMSVVTGHKGKLGYIATARGEAGHSALAPRYVNALYLAADFVQELRAIQKMLATSGARDNAYSVPYSTVHVGTLSGGTALNIVPDHAELRFELRHLPGDDRARIERLFDEAAGDGITLEQTVAYPGLETDPGSDATALVQRLAATRTNGKVAFGTEAGLLAGQGIDTLVCGPGSMAGQGHKPDEFVTTGQLAACDAMMDRVLAQLTGGG